MKLNNMKKLSAALVCSIIAFASCTTHDYSNDVPSMVPDTTIHSFTAGGNDYTNDTSHTSVEPADNMADSTHPAVGAH